MNNEKNKETERPESYPKPSEKDSQLRNQPEFIEENPNDFHDASVSPTPATTGREKNVDEKEPEE